MRPEEAFGIVLRNLRNEKAISQEKLALEANLARTYVSLLERGLRQPSLTTILNIAAVLGTPPPRILELVVETLKPYQNTEKSDV